MLLQKCCGGVGAGGPKSLISYFRPKWGLRALLINPPQQVPDVSAEGDQAEIPDAEAEAYANVEATTSLTIGLGQTEGKGGRPWT